MTPAEIMAVAAFGRAGLHDLFRIFGESPAVSHRDAAGRAIASLWAQDQLIAEEEQALRAQGLRGDLERAQALSPGHSNRDSDHGDLRPSLLERR